MAKFLEVTTIEGAPTIINQDAIIKVEPIVKDNQSIVTMSCQSGNQNYPIKVRCSLGFEEWVDILQVHTT